MRITELLTSFQGLKKILVLLVHAFCSTAVISTETWANEPIRTETRLNTVDTSAKLYSELPEKIKKTGEIRFVGDSHPPYRIVTDRRLISAGLEPDLARELEKVLGVPIKHNVVNSLSATLAGLAAGRYDVALGPAVATKERLVKFDGVTWLTTRPAFVFPLDREKRYRNVFDLCGQKIAYVAGSVTERVTKKVVQICIDAGKPAAVHVPLVDTNMTLIATQAGRADVAGMTLTAGLHVVHENAQRFGMYSDESGGLGKDLLSLFVTKESDLATVMQKAMNLLMTNGQYSKVMSVWGVEGVSVLKAEMNLAK